MRIAHVSATFPPDHSGTGVVCYHNALGLARLGHQVTVFTSHCPGQAEQDPPGVTVHRLRPSFRLGNAPFLPGLLRLSGFDVVHLHYPFYFGAEMVCVASWARHWPYVVTYHQDVILRGPLQLPTELHHRTVARSILGRARRVLATSWDYALASRLRHWTEGRPRFVEELPNGVDARRFSPAVEGGTLRQRHGLQAEDRVVLFVGALDQAHYFKGVDVLLQALAQLDDPFARLLVVGEGDLRWPYEQQARGLGLGGRAIFCGRVGDDELPQYYAGCDLLALPSTTMGEAFGVVLLEAMASGKPVVASNLPGVRAVVSDGVDGVLVAPSSVDDLAARMRALLQDPELRTAMGARGRAKVEEEYDWAHIIPRLASVYERVLSEAREQGNA